MTLISKKSSCIISMQNIKRKIRWLKMFNNIPLAVSAHQNKAVFITRVKIMGEVKVESHNMGPTFSHFIDSHPFR